MLNFVYHIPTKVLFGKGQVSNLAREIKSFGGNRVLLVYGGGSIKKIGLHNAVVSQLNAEGIFFKELSGVQPNPRITSAREGVRLCKENKLDFVLAVGGGSTLDCAKTIAGGALYDGDCWDFFCGKAAATQALPLGAIMTLAATGSEMNGFSVMSNDEMLDKFPTYSEALRPKFSILDPTYTISVNAHHTAAGTADIMSHIFEQYFSNLTASDVPDRLAEALLKVCIKYGPIAVKEPENYEARANLMWASSLALNTMIGLGKDGGDWAVHFIEHELSAIYDLTHGIGLAILTPRWMEYVLRNDNIEKFADYGRNVWNIQEGSASDIAHKSIAKTYEFFASLGIPMNLREVGIDESRLEEMAAKAVRLGGATGAIGLFRRLAKPDILEILKKSL